MKKVKILNKAETLSHNQRWKYMIELGKTSTKDLSVSQSLRELACSEIHYERLLALMSAHGSFDNEIIIKILESPSVIGMFSAVRLAARHLDNEQLCRIIPTLSKDKRMDVIMALFKEKRTDIIEKIYNTSGVSEQQNILLFTSNMFFKKHINAEKIESFTQKQWRQAAKRFPSLAYEYISGILEKSSNPSWVAVSAVQSLATQYYRNAPATGLSLIKQALSHTNFINYLPLEKYFLLFPQEIAELILKHRTSNRFMLNAATLRNVKPETLCELEERKIIASLSYGFQKLRPEQRVALYNTVGESWRGENGALPLNYVKGLPKQTREAEALRAFNLPLLEAKPMERIPYLSVLTFDVALTLSASFLSQPDGELRAQVVSSLVQCGKYDKSTLDEILDFCINRANEQDPVRLAMTAALASLPPSRWSENHLPKLRQIIKAALSARDCSYQTMDNCVRLLFKIMTVHTDFVIAELPALAERMGSLHVSRLESFITDSDLVKLDSCLYPLLKNWISRGKLYFAVSLIQSFGRRVKSVYKVLKNENKQMNFIKLLIELTDDKRGYEARLGLETLINLEIMEEVSELIPHLLKRDSSWIQVNAVSQYLHRHCQNLLTPFLSPQVYKGRFSSGKTSIILSFDFGFVRWTANQQQIYADALNTILNGTGRNAWELYHCVSRLSEMPSIGLTALIKLAGHNAEDDALRDKAVEALGRTDGGRGIQTLLEALDDSRANVAIYALRRSILNMPVKSALELLSKAPRNKITVTKEIIRLAGEFYGEESYNFIVFFLDSENLHQDVHIAALRALWKHLNNVKVWSHFHAAALSDNAALARSVIRIPQDGLTLEARERLCEHLTLLLKSQHAQIRMEALERLLYMPLGYADELMFESLTGLIEDVDLDIVALVAKIIISTYISTKADEIVRLFASVKRSKSFAVIVDAFQYCNVAGNDDIVECAESLIHEKIKQRQLSSQSLRLTLALLNPLNIYEYVENMCNDGILHPGAIESGAKNWNRAVKTFPNQEIAILEEKLRLSKNTIMRRLGLGLFHELVKHYGWLDEYYKCLEEYCNDIDLWISETAGFIEPPIEKQ